jgi:hypothetical protein
MFATCKLLRDHKGKYGFGRSIGCFRDIKSGRDFYDI